MEIETFITIISIFLVLVIVLVVVGSTGNYEEIVDCIEDKTFRECYDCCNGIESNFGWSRFDNQHCIDFCDGK